MFTIRYIKNFFHNNPKIIWLTIFEISEYTKEPTSWPKVLGHFPIFLIQKCIRRTKHLTLLPSPPLPPTRTMLSPEAKMLPLDFNIGWGRGGGVGECKIFFRVFAFLRWWHYLVWMCSVPRTFGQDGRRGKCFVLPRVSYGPELFSLMHVFHEGRVLRKQNVSWRVIDRGIKMCQNGKITNYDMYESRARSICKKGLS